MTEKKLPILLVIGNPEENWYDICKEYSDKFTVEQATWEEIALSSFSDKDTATIALGPSNRANCPHQKTTRYNVCPTLVLIRMFSRYVGHRLGHVPDYRNILYGIYHSNTPMINGFGAVMAELEKPIMYGRLRAIRDKVGEDIFPLIKQYYYPEYIQIATPPPEPFVLKVGFPHAGFGKIRIHNRDELEDIKSIIALSNNYCAAEPLIDTDYELRIVFIAPDYYRVHKRSSINWKVNFGMMAEREDTEMNPRWKRWVDLIYQTYPDMLSFDIDALVDKQGKEYILEVNGSAQGFAPEHGSEDLIHFKELVIRKLESLTNTKILEKRSPVPLPFEIQDENSSINNNISSTDKEQIEQKEVEIVNLKNKVEDLEKELEDLAKFCSQPNTVYISKPRRQYQIAFLICLILLISLLVFNALPIIRH